MSAPRTPAALAVALRVVDAAARLAPATERPGLRGEWRAELWHRAHRLQREGRWGPAPAAALLLRSLGSIPDALDLRLCGPDGAADPWIEGARAGRRVARITTALLCTALAVSVAAFTCALASTVVSADGPPAWSRIDPGARAFILAIGALWSMALVAASALAARRLAPATGRTTAASGILSLSLALLGATQASGGAGLAAAALPARTAAAWLAIWSVSIVAFAVLRRWPAAHPDTRARASPDL